MSTIYTTNSYLIDVGRTPQEWSKESGVPVEAILQRLNVLGWTQEQAVHRYPPTHNRPKNDLFFLRIAGQVAMRGTCARRMVGCVLVDKHHNILSSGYNALPQGIQHCIDNPCAGAKAKSGDALHACGARHAEDVALMKCRDIYSIHTCYSTLEPCHLCIRRLLDTSCQRIVFAESYPSSDREVWEKAGREWIQYKLT